MGNWCCGCLNKEDDYYDRDSERRPILGDTDRVGINDARTERLGSSSAEVLVVSNGGDNVIPSYGAIPEESNQSQLVTNVLNKLTASVVDIAAIEKTGVQANFSEREKRIQEKLSKIKKSIVLGHNQTLTFKGDNTHKNNDPMPLEDYREIMDISRLVKETIDSSFKLTSEKQFIVTFNNVDNFQTR